MEVSIRTRGRSRSVALTDRDRVVNDENSVKATAPNLNGDECGDVEKIKENIESENNGEDNVEEDKVDASENDGSIDKPGKGKKRKASELKSEDENANEESISKKVELADPIPSTDQDSKGELKADESSASEVDLENPQKQTLGKGKRARIPNKRYSEILSPNRRKSIENGSERIESENDVAADTPVKEETLNATVTSLKSVINAASPSNPYKKQRISVDLSDPKYLKPFKLGWKRELVWRAVNDSSTKRNGDIYYYTPLGKKVRSMREVAENLTNKKLSIENFTFFKESLGIDDPEKEIIRNAKKPAGVSLSKKTPIKAEPTKAEPTKAEPIKAQQIKPSPAKVIQPKPVQAAKVVKTPKSPKLPPTPKISSPKISSPRVDGNQTADSPAIKSKATAKSLGNFKIKLPPKKDKKSLKAEEKMETEVETTPVRAAVNRKSGKWTSFDQEGDKPCQPCSIRCEGVLGIVPTLQCRLCLCLYHHECVGLAPHLSLPYVCKNCHLETQGQKPVQSAPIAAPPPLTPINSLKSSGVQSTVLPKLQRIPRPPSAPPCLPQTEPVTELPELPHLTPKPTQLSLSPVPKITKTTEVPAVQAPSNENKCIVGSVTTWLPHNSKIVDNIQQASEEPTEVPRPQYVEFLGGRKFLVIPKHNFMSVSPTVATTAVSKQNSDKNSEVIGTTMLPVDSASLGLESVPDIKPEPESPSKPENSQTPEAMEVDSTPCENVTTMEVDEKTGDDGKVVDKKSESSSTSPVKAKKRTIKLSSITNSEEKEGNKFMENYLQNLSYGYNTLLYVFQYLKVQDLLRAGCVCTMWRDIASHPMLWRTVRMKNSQVHSFEGLANTLKKHGTRHLDLRKMLLPTGGDEIWPEFSKAIERVDTLSRIELCRCPATVVGKLAITNPRLEVINAVTIKCESMDLEPLKTLTNIKELRLKSTGGLTISSDIDSLKDMIFLRHLALTSIRDLDSMNLSVIGELVNLESLDLGECTDFPKTFGSDILVKLEKLEKLRLEKGQGNCHTFEILEAVKDMPHLEQLELVNFDIKAGFDKALGVCQNIKKMLIIPTYISQSATTNHMVLGGVLRLQRTLSHFVWGVTLELLRVTELFVDQCEEPKKEKKQVGNGDSIPVLKPIPLLMDNENEIPPAHDPPQVEILALPSLQKLLMQNLPTTRVKILKIPFHATWRQSITDSVN